MNILELMYMFSSNRWIFILVGFFLFPILLFAQSDTGYSSLLSLNMHFTRQDTSKTMTINSDKWLAMDKGYHLVGSIIASTGISNSCLRFAKIKKEKAVIIGAGFTFALGLSKEFYDSRHQNNFFSWKDLTADLVGILIGSLILQID